MKIIYLSSEAVPFAKVGGLADVAGSLPCEISKLGHDIIVLMPRYKTIDIKKFKLKKTGVKFDVEIAGVKYNCGLTEGRLPASKVKVYFIENKKVFGSGSVYDGCGTPIKFSLFSHASLKAVKSLKFKPDIINCNDWHTGLTPLLLKNDPFFKNTKTVMTIHNIGYQGEFPVKDFKYTGVPKSEINIFKYKNKVNFLKAGILCADAVSTVSPTYAKEIQTRKYGHGMEKFLKSIKVYGILNGADYEHWNPEKDKYIIKKYNKKTVINGKKLCKKNLQKACELKNEDSFMIGMVTRMVDQKGFDILSKVINDILKLDLQFIILATGQPNYEKLFTKLQKKHPEKLNINLKFDNELAHKIEAGADVFLMPSRYEPCGLNQIYSLKYGTSPIVRKTGGLADTVVNFNEKTNKGTGFVFDKYSAKDLLKSVKRAYKLYRDKKKWDKLVQNAMNQDFSWKRSAKEYIKLYRKIILHSCR
ncbi:MAG: glycogen/starch synthase [Armatimonadota bacterium]